MKNKEITKKEIIEKLVEREIDFSKKAKKEDLLELLENAITESENKKSASEKRVANRLDLVEFLTENEIEFSESEKNRYFLIKANSNSYTIRYGRTVQVWSKNALNDNSELFKVRKQYKTIFENMSLLLEYLTQLFEDVE